MTKTIQQLSSAVVKKLRSDIAFTSVAHCVEELVLNSIDAGASCIAVNLNLPFYQIQVIDNGSGIDAKQMKIIGNRYATSKCHTLEDLQNLKSGGFRGEALASLKEVSSVLMIESRPASSSDTFCKIFTQGKTSDPKKSLNYRPSKGTTVSVYDFLYNMPVRKSSVSETLDFEECRKLLQSIALMHPNISFTLKNETTGEMSLQLKKCTSVYHAFLQIFGPGRAINLKNINYQKDEYQITGCISTECHISKDLQFFYVNKRRVLRTKLHKLINNILNKALNVRQKTNLNAKNSTPDASSPSKYQCMCIFALNISCPYDKYDIILEPRKTMIEFSDWQTVLKTIEDCLIEFLKKENLYSDPEKSDVSLLNDDFVASSKHFNSNIQDCKPGLFSNAVRRLQFVPESVSVNEVSRPNEENMKEISKKNLGSECANSLSQSVCENVEKSTSIDNTSSPVGEQSSMSGKRNDSINDESCINTNALCSSLSVLNSFKSVMAKSFLHESTGTGFSSNSREAEQSLPCRSVFPSVSPVMLRVPIKSTLSSMETASSDSNFLKLKAKFQYLPKKERNYPLIDSKNDNKQTKVCLRSNNAPTPLFSKNCVLSNNVLQNFDNKEKSKLKHCNKPNTNDKSLQCPSISFEKFQKKQHDIANSSEIKEKSVSKTTKDKSLQCPSVTSKESKIVSKFTFEKQERKFPLQNFRQSGKLGRKISRKTSSNDTIVTADNLHNHVSIHDDSHQTKRLRSSSVEENTNAVFGRNNAKADSNGDEIAFGDLTNVRVSSELESICCDGEFDYISKNTSADPCSEPFIVSESKTTNSDSTNPSFNLQIFSEANPRENNVQKLNAITELDAFRKSRLSTDNAAKNAEDQESNQNVYSDVVSAEIFNELENFNTNSLEKTDLFLQSSVENRKRALNADNILSEFEISNANSLEKHRLEENCVTANTYLEVEISNKRILSRGTVLSSLEHSNLNHSKNHVFDSYKKKSKRCSFQNSNKRKMSKVKDDISSESLDVKSPSDDQNEYDFVENVSPATFSCTNFTLDIHVCEPEENTTHNVKLDSNPFIEQFPSASQGFSLEQNCPKSKEQNSERNFSPSKFTGKDTLDNFLSEPEKKLSQNIYLETNTFMEQLPSVSQGFEKSSRDQKISEDNSSNCIFPELSAESHVTESPNMEVEVYQSCTQKFSPPVVETSFTEIVRNSPTKTINGKQNENVVNESTFNVGSASDVNNLSSVCAGNTIRNCNAQHAFDNKSEDGNKHWQIYAEPKFKRNVYINVTTGNSTYIVPEQQGMLSDQDANTNKKIFKKSHFFLSHDYSPFISKTQTPENKLNDNLSEVQNILKSFMENKEKLKWYEKWRIPEEISNLNDNKIEDMLNEWDNPMFDIPYEVHSITENKAHSNISQMCKFFNSYRFTKSTLSSLQIIGQVDSKFIACILHDYTGTTRGQRLLALFDQHAVHERIRLEELKEDLYELNDNDEKSVKTSLIDPPLQVILEEEEIRLLQTYHKKLQLMGIHLNMESDSSICSIFSVPKCLVHKDTQELRRSVSDSVVILQNSIREWLTSLSKTRSIPQVLPKSLLSVLNYQACRGAVKFGDPLTLEQCRDLLKSLSGCSLPFQCAHGRPSVAPLLDLKKIEALCKKRPSPQLQNLVPIS